MSNDLIPTEAHINALTFMARNASASKFYQSLGGEAGIMSIMLLARELNVSPMQALAGGIWNIQGKVEMSARMMNMKIRQAGHKMKIESDSNRCVITGTRKDTGEDLTVTFSMDDASRAGLSGGNVWKKYPREMLFNRCLSIIARMLFPDVIGNCYVEGEIRDSIEVQEETKKKPYTNENMISVKYEPMKVDHHQEEISVHQEMPAQEPKEIEVCITEDQAMVIEALLEGTNDAELRTPMLEYFRVPSVLELKQSQFDNAVKILKKKRK